MSNKTLNEATVRQFMKLVNHKPATISNFIKEQYANEEEKVEEAYAEGHGDEQKMEEVAVEEEEAVAEMAPAMEAEAEDADPVGDEMPEPEGMEDKEDDGVDITPEMAKTLIELGDMLKGAMPEMADDEDDMMGDEPADIPDMPDAPPPMEEEINEGEEEATKEEMNEEDMIQEVARRVAARILKAKKAKQDLDKALGNK